MSIVKGKSFPNFFIILVVLGLIAILLYTFVPVQQVPQGTILILDGNKAQDVWFAPGGKYPPSGYQLKKVDTIQPGDKVTVKSNKNGETTNLLIDLRLIKRYVRIKTPSGKIGWADLSLFIEQ